MAQIRSASAELIAFFETGDIPTADNFTDFILSTAVYDGTLPIISGSAVSTGSFGMLRTSKIVNAGVSTNITLGANLIPGTTNIFTLGSNTSKFKEIVTTTGSFEVISSSLIPDLDNTYDLGSSTNEWKDLYIDGTIFADTISNSGSAVENRSVTIVTASFTHGISSSIIPDGDNAYDLGSSTKEWKDLFIDGVAKIDALGSVAGDTSIAYISQLSGSAAEPALTASVTVVPGVDNTYDLGTAALSWKNLHVQGTATIGTLALTQLANNIIIPLVSQSMAISGSITPSLDDTFDLGSSAREWKDLYLDGIGYIDSIGASAEDTNIAYIKELSGSAAAPSITASVNIVPGIDNTYSLGASGKEFKDLFIDGTANIDLGLIDSASIDFLSSSLTPYTDDTYSLGSSTNQWKDLFIDGTANIDLGLIDSASVGLVSSSLIPDADDTYDLGSSTKEWKDLFIDGTANIDVLSADSGVINQFTSNFLPSTNGTLNLGSTSKFWNKLHITNITSSGNISASGAIIANSLSLPTITRAAATDTSFYSINGTRGEIRSQLQSSIAADTGFRIELRNTSITATSLIVANVIGGEGAIITGSVVTANVVGANTASLNFFNTGATIVDNAKFTASFAIF